MLFLRFPAWSWNTGTSAVNSVTLRLCDEERNVHHGNTWGRAKRESPAELPCFLYCTVGSYPFRLDYLGLHAPHGAVPANVCHPRKAWRTRRQALPARSFHCYRE